MYDRSVTCCFTGHRPVKLPWGMNEQDPRCLTLKEQLAATLEGIYESGYRHFICGMAIGCDTYFAEEVLQLKEQHPEVILEAAIPCDGQDAKWNSKQKEAYARLLAQCDFATHVSRSYTPDCMMRRNIYMIDHSSLLLACFTLLLAAVKAVREPHLKRRLAYSTVSNLSYILFGMSLLTTGGLIAGLSHMLFHGIMKITLFFCAGTVLCKTGREYVPQTVGLGRKMPLTFLTFGIAGLALTGTPLLPGFISKMNLLHAAADLGSPLAMVGIAALLLSAVLTAAYLIPMTIRAFLVNTEASPSFTEKDKDPGARMLVPFAVLVAAMLILGIHAEPLMNALERLITDGM